MNRGSWSRWLVVLSLSLGVVFLLSCRPATPIHLLVFIEATQDLALNGKILAKYLEPIYLKLAQTERPFEIRVFPISGNTAGETELLQFSNTADWMSGQKRAALRKTFVDIKPLYDRVYPAGSSYLIDILGTTVLLDSYLGANRGESTEVLYLSDMVQQQDVNGYDFTEYARGKSLEQCKEDLEGRLGPNLRHRDLFATARIHIVYIGVDTLRRGGDESLAESGPVTRNMDRIKTFWTKDFFGEFLKVQEVQSYSGSVEDALGNIFP